MKEKTKRKLKDKAVPDNFNKDILLSIIEDTPALICRFQYNGRIIFTNKSFCDYLDKTKDQLTGKKIISVFPKKNILKLEDAIKNIKNTNSEIIFITTDKSSLKKEKQYKWIVKPYLKKSKIEGYQITGAEQPKKKLKNENGLTTEKYKTAFQNSEERFKSLFESTSDWIWEINLEGIHTYSNPIIESILGYSPDEIIGKNTFSLIHNEDKAKVESTFESCINEKKGWRNLVVRWKHKDGSFHHLESTSLPLFSKKGDLQGFLGTDRDITGHILSEEKLRQIINNMDYLISKIDRQGNFLYVSPFHEKILGYKQEELIGKNVFSFLRPEEADRILNEFKSILISGSNSIQLEFLHKDGKYRWIETTGRYILNDAGDITGSILGSRDITERKTMEQTLKESEFKYRKIFEDIQDVYYQVDVNGKIITISPSIKRYTDFDDEILLGKQVEEIYFNPDDRAKLLKILLEKGEVLDYEILLRNKYNKPVYASLNAHCLLDKEGKFNGIEGTIRDISQRKQIEKDLQEKTELLNRFFSLALENLCIVNKEGYFLTLNQTWENTLGYSLDELKGKKILDFVHPDDMESTLSIVSKLSKNKLVLNFTNRYRCKDGSYKWLEWRSFPFKELIYIAARDITNRLSSEEKIKKMNEELKELNKNKDKFFSIFAHDLKSPFQALLGMSELMADPDENLTLEETKEYNIRINNILKNQYALIQNLLDWSRLQLGRVTVNKILLKPHELVNNVINLLSGNYLKKEIKILNEIEKNMSLYGDPDMLRSILQNFISNSIKFTSKYGVIKIKAKYSNGFAQIFIEDNGIGIPKEGLDKIFKLDEKYTTLGTEGESGSGLGFLLCRDMIEKHGGKLEVESEINKGTVVKFTVPLIKK
jgi:PAS domain S-box-containing protein